MRFVGRPDLTPLIDEYSHGEDSLGPFWQQPGRRILEEHLKDVPFPSSAEWDTSLARRIHFAGDLAPYLKVPHYSLLEEDELPSDPEIKTDVILQKRLTWDRIGSYLRTWSSLHSYHEKHPDEQNKKGHGREGDIVDRFVDSIQKRMPGADGVEVAWPVSLLLIKKASS